MAAIGSFIIHLERAEERAAQVAALQAALPGPVEILAAVDGRAGETGPEVHDPELGWEPAYPFAMNATEIAVFRSHRRAWARIVETRLMAGLVVEDDVEITPEPFAAAMALSATHMRPDLVIRLPQKPREKGAVLARSGETRLILPDVVGLGMQATLVGRIAAARLLRATARFDRPVDVALQMVWKTGVEVQSLWPTGIRDISDNLGGSTLKKRKGFASRLRAEWARMRFRRALAQAAHEAREGRADG